jgi:hypothetical protein
MSQSYLVEEITKGTGKFDPKKQYAFTNWQTLDFTFKWAGEEFTVAAGEVAVYPQYLAYHAAKHFVNKIMIDAGKEVQLMNPVVRKEYEEKTLREVSANEENPYVASIREQERAKLLKEMGMAGADVGVTSSETLREAHETVARLESEAVEKARKEQETKDKRLAGLAKAREAKKAYAKANTD